MDLGVFKKQAFASLFWSGIFFCIIGVLGLINPQFMAIYIVYMIAVFFFLAGFATLYMGFKFHKNPDFHSTLYIFMGLTQLLFAISLVAFPLKSQFLIFIYIAVFLLIKGIFILLNQMSHKHLFPVLSQCSLSTGLIDVLFGVTLLVMPFFSNMFLLMVLAWYFLFCGINFIASAFSLKKAQN